MDRSLNSTRIGAYDDNPTNLEVIRAQLEDLPYRVKFASSGKKAAQLIDSGFTPDLVLLDYEMPVMNGIETCKFIRSRFSPIEVPIVFITAYDADERIKQCFEAGANDYLRKPITQNTLLPRIDNLLRLSGLHQRSNQFVPWQALKMLGYESILDFKVGDFCERELAILFTDIRDFTQLADEMPAEDLMRFVTSYMSFFGPIIAKHGGHINKFLGDGMMAVFPDYRQGIKAGLEFSSAVEDYNRRYRSGSKRTNVKIGIAVHGSNMLFGVVGYASRADITAISKGVNLASRLEGMTKIFGAEMIVTEEVLLASGLDKELDFRYLGSHYLRGTSNPSKLVEIVPNDSSSDFRRRLEYKQEFEKAVIYLDSKNLGRALDIFEDLLKKYPEDIALEYLKKLCLEFYDADEFEVA